MTAFLFLLNASLSALNVYVYASSGNPINLAVATFCGLVAIATVVLE